MRVYIECVKHFTLQIDDLFGLNNKSVTCGFGKLVEALRINLVSAVHVVKCWNTYFIADKQKKCLISYKDNGIFNKKKTKLWCMSIGSVGFEKRGKTVGLQLVGFTSPFGTNIKLLFCTSQVIWTTDNFRIWVIVWAKLMFRSYTSILIPKFHYKSEIETKVYLLLKVSNFTTSHVILSNFSFVFNS